MPLRLGTIDPTAIRAGSGAVSRVYLGEEMVWPENVWRGVLEAISVLDAAAVMQRAGAGDIGATSALSGTAGRQRGTTAAMVAVSQLQASATRIKTASGTMVTHSAMVAAAQLLTQVFASASLDAVSALDVAASRNRRIAAGLVAASSLAGSASRLRTVTAGFQAISAFGTLAGLRTRLVSGSIAAVSALTGVADVEAGNAFVYWRLLSNTAVGDINLWDLQPDPTAGVFESGDLTGTDIAAGLTYANLKFFLASNVETTFGTLYQGNPFAASGARLITNTNAGVGSYLKFTFAAPVTIGSLKWYTLSGYPARQPSNMSLQHSDDGSSWTTYATLTNAGKISPATWLNISEGVTRAAT